MATRLSEVFQDLLGRMGQLVGEQAMMQSDEILELAGGRTLGYAEVGDPDGFPLCLCHGAPGSRLEGALFSDGAEAVGLRLIVVDRPGYGQSVVQPGGTFAGVADDIVAVMDALGLARFAVLGFSGGGPYAMACAHRYPERVSALGLCASAGRWNSTVFKDGYPAEYREIFEFAVNDTPAFTERFGFVTADAEALFGLMLQGAPDNDLALFADQTVKRAYLRDLSESMAQVLDGFIQDARLLTNGWGFYPDQIRTPTFCWHGAEDRRMSPEISRTLCAGIPGASLEVWEGLGHFGLVRRWEEVANRLVSVSNEH